MSAASAHLLDLGGMSPRREVGMGSWEGACHCGTIRFRVDGEIAETITCDCSLYTVSIR